jgi:hypothetical protein
MENFANDNARLKRRIFFAARRLQTNWACQPRPTN